MEQSFRPDFANLESKCWVLFVNETTKVTKRCCSPALSLRASGPVVGVICLCVSHCLVATMAEEPTNAALEGLTQRIFGESGIKIKYSEGTIASFWPNVSLSKGRNSASRQS